MSLSLTVGVFVSFDMFVSLLHIWYDRGVVEMRIRHVQDSKYPYEQQGHVK